MATEKTIGICVPLKQAETLHKYLLKKDLLMRDLKIYKNSNFIYFPVKKVLKDMDMQNVSIIKKEFEMRMVKPMSYKEKTSIPEKLKQKLPTSYDIIGDILLIKLQDRLLKYKTEIGESLINSHKNINVVCLIKPVSGELRTRNVEIIAGEQRTETLHTEYGLKYELDINKTYFSPRLATERRRIANLVKPRETIVDMFAGVAPFPIMIARYAQPKIIYAIDKNMDAIKYAHQNLKRNKVLDKIEIIHGDAREISNNFLKQKIKADRIIMNLPFSAYQFFPQALQISANNSTIHYYDIIKEDEIPKRIEQLKQTAIENGRTLTSLVVRKIKTYAPREFYIGIDISAKKHADVA